MLMNRFDMTALQTRLASAAVLMPIVLVVLYYGGWPFIVLLAVLGGIALCEWIGVSLKLLGNERYIYSGLGIFYILASFTCAYFVYTTLGFFWSVIFILMVWGSDSGAYFVGKAIGGAKLAKSISPNKTWAGFIGALVMPALIGVIGLFILRGLDGFIGEQAFKIAFIGILIGVAGQTGDLLVSALKRKAGVKDTGQLIPGHGGLLDRVDSLMLAAPVYLLLMMTIFNGA